MVSSFSLGEAAAVGGVLLPLLPLPGGRPTVSRCLILSSSNCSLQYLPACLAWSARACLACPALVSQPLMPFWPLASLFFDVLCLVFVEYLWGVF